MLLAVPLLPPYLTRDTTESDEDIHHTQQTEQKQAHGTNATTDASTATATSTATSHLQHRMVKQSKEEIK